MSTFYLTKPTETAEVTFTDQNGRPFTGDLSTVVATSDQSGFVGAALSAPENGRATLTLSQGTPGTANITVSVGAVSSAPLEVESYEPVLTTITIGTPS